MISQMYGIKNCDTVKKARQWLDKHAVPYHFHDFKTEGIERDTLLEWGEKVGLALLINRRGSTWRQLSDNDKALIDSGMLSDEVLTLIKGNSSLIKRPVLRKEGQLFLGFKESEYASIFNK